MHDGHYLCSSPKTEILSCRDDAILILSECSQYVTVFSMLSFCSSTDRHKFSVPMADKSSGQAGEKRKITKCDAEHGERCFGEGKWKKGM